MQQCKLEGGTIEFKTILERPACGENQACLVSNGCPSCVCKPGYIQNGKSGCISMFLRDTNLILRLIVFTINISSTWNYEMVDSFVIVIFSSKVGLMSLNNFCRGKPRLQGSESRYILFVCQRKKESVYCAKGKNCSSCEVHLKRLQIWVNVRPVSGRNLGISWVWRNLFCLLYTRYVNILRKEKIFKVLD